MAKKITFTERFPFAGLFVVIAIAFAIPLTIYSLNNVSTQTEQHASTIAPYCSTTNTKDCMYGCSPTTTGGTCLAAPTSTPTPCPSSTQQILSEFGANITGSSTCAMRNTIYNAFTRLYTGKYRTLITKEGTYNIRLTTRTLHDGNCGGFLQDKNNLDFYNLADCVSDTSKSTYMLSHEITHILARRVVQYTNYPYSSLVSKDPSCYKNGFLKTYSGINISGVDPKFESFAEAAALFIVNSRVGLYGTISNFQSQCPNTYSAIKSSIF